MYRVNDSGVSPVVGVILMIAVTILLGATLFAMDYGAVRVEDVSVNGEGADFNSNGDIDHIGLKLISTENGTVKQSEYMITIVSNNNHVNLEPNSDWEIGEKKWIPCLEEGTNYVDIIIRETVAGSFSLKCDEIGGDYEESQNQEVGKNSDFCWYNIEDTTTVERVAC